MQHSCKRLILSLLAVSALVPAAITQPVQAMAARPRHSHPSATHRANPKAVRHTSTGPSGRLRKACRGRGECPTDTGGTPPFKPTIVPPPAVSRTPAHQSGSRTPAHQRASRTPAHQPGSRTPDPAAEGTTPAPRTPAESTAAVIAAVLASPCANTELTPSAEDLPLVRGAVLCLINRERAEHSLKPLTISPRLEAAAESHCAELISADYFAHVSPDGETPVDRIRRTGYIPGPEVGYVIGENLAWGTYSLSTPQSIVAAWIASPGHLANILESQYTETGVGIIPAVPASVGGGAPGASYAQEFGVIIH